MAILRVFVSAAISSQDSQIE